MGIQSTRGGLAMDELERLALRLAAGSGLQMPVGAEEPGLEHRPSVLAIDQAKVNGWVIAWPPGTDTGFHDHAGSRAVVVGLRGAVVEQRPVWGADPVSQVLEPGGVVLLSDVDVHRMHNLDGDETAYSLHVYSPPLTRQGVYGLEDGRPVLRRVIGGDVELGRVSPTTNSHGCSTPRVGREGGWALAAVAGVHATRDNAPDGMRLGRVARSGRVPTVLALVPAPGRCPVRWRRPASALFPGRR
jgi:Cysteine dioxygenase type I